MADLTQKELKEFLNYDPESGDFVWVKSNKKAGYKRKDGYVVIGFKNKVYKAHRLAFLFVIGIFPEKEIDHINRINSDNRWRNLREASHQQNSFNRKLRIDNELNIKGVYKHRNKYQVQLRINGKVKHFGTFDNLELAGLVAIEARNKFHGEFVSHE